MARRSGASRSAVISPLLATPWSARLAATIAGKSGAAIALGKRSFLAQPARGGALGAASDVAGAAMVVTLLAVDDAREGIGAFVEKRAPEWRHR